MGKSPCFAETFGKYVQIHSKVSHIFPYNVLSIVSLLYSFPSAIFSSAGHGIMAKLLPETEAPLQQSPEVLQLPALMF